MGGDFNFPGNCELMYSSVRDSGAYNHLYRDCCSFSSYVILITLMYAMTFSKLDIAYAAVEVAQFMAMQGKVNWVKVNNGNSVQWHRDLHGFCDLVHAGNIDDRKSTSRHIFLLAGCPIAWQYRLQQVQAMSPCEAEYIAASDADRRANWLRQFLRKLG